MNHPLTDYLFKHLAPNKEYNPLTTVLHLTRFGGKFFQVVPVEAALAWTLLLQVFLG